MLASLIISPNLPVPTKDKYENGMDRNNDLRKYLHKCIMANSSAVMQQAVHTTYRPPSPGCSTRAIQKSPSLNEKCWRIFPPRVGRIDRYQKNDKTQRARGLGRKTRKEIGKENHMTALRFQAGCGHRTSLASL